MSSIVHGKWHISWHHDPLLALHSSWSSHSSALGIGFYQHNHYTLPSQPDGDGLGWDLVVRLPEVDAVGVRCREGWLLPTEPRVATLPPWPNGKESSVCVVLVLMLAMDVTGRVLGMSCPSGQVSSVWTVTEWAAGRAELRLEATTCVWYYLSACTGSFCILLLNLWCIFCWGVDTGHLDFQMLVAVKYNKWGLQNTANK